jgi:hypothetical protein
MLTITLFFKGLYEGVIQKFVNFLKYLLNVNVYCSEILSAYLVEYYQHILKGTVNASINNDFILLLD